MIGSSRDDTIEENNPSSALDLLTPTSIQSEYTSKPTSMIIHNKLAETSGQLSNRETSDPWSVTESSNVNSFPKGESFTKGPSGIQISSVNHQQDVDTSPVNSRHDTQAPSVDNNHVTEASPVNNQRKTQASPVNTQHETDDSSGNDQHGTPAVTMSNYHNVLSSSQIVNNDTDSSEHRTHYETNSPPVRYQQNIDSSTINEPKYTTVVASLHRSSVVEDLHKSNATFQLDTVTSNGEAESTTKWQLLETEQNPTQHHPEEYSSTTTIIENSNPYTVPSSNKLPSINTQITAVPKSESSTIGNELIESGFLPAKVQPFLIPGLLAALREEHHFDPPSSSINLFGVSVPLCPTNTCMHRCHMLREPDGLVDCNCDIDCFDYGDCCPDIEQFCRDILEEENAESGVQTSSSKYFERYGDGLLSLEQTILKRIEHISTVKCDYCIVETEAYAVPGTSQELWIETITACPNNKTNDSENTNRNLHFKYYMSFAGTWKFFQHKTSLNCQLEGMFLAPWIPTIMCSMKQTQEALLILATSGTETFLDFTEHSCKLSYDIYDMPPPLLRFLTKPNFIKTCNQSLQLELQEFKDIEKACFSFQSPVTLEQDGNVLIFKNSFCAICNGYSSTESFMCNHTVSYGPLYHESVPIDTTPVNSTDTTLMQNIKVELQRYGDLTYYDVRMGKADACQPGSLYNPFSIRCEALPLPLLTGNNNVPDFVWTTPFKKSLTSPALLLIIFTTNTDFFNESVAINALEAGMERFFQNIQQSVELRVGPLKQYDQYLPYWSSMDEDILQSKQVHAFDISLPGSLSISNYYNHTTNILWYLDNNSQLRIHGMSVLSATLLNHQLPQVPSSRQCAKTQSKLFLFSIDQVPYPQYFLPADTVGIYNSDKKTITAYANDVIGLVYELGTASNWLWAEKPKFLTCDQPGPFSESHEFDRINSDKVDGINSATQLDGSFGKIISLLFCIHLILLSVLANVVYL